MTKQHLERVLVIGGPTASGKSSTAIQVAQQLGGEIISADSMQVYRGLDIGTAKVSKSEQGLVKHHLIDCCEPGDFFSVAHFQRLALAAITDIVSRGLVPIVCGGTGLYLSALIDGIDYIDQPVDPDIRASLTSRAEREGLALLYQELACIDPDSAKQIKPQDQKRIIRALEVYQQTGQTRSDQIERSRLHGPAFDYHVYILNHDRPILYQRINERVEAMFDAGLVEEVRQLRETMKQVQWNDQSDVFQTIADPVLPGASAWQAIGYKEVLAYLDGDQTAHEAADLIARSSRRYAKRQLTWFRRIKQAIWLENLSPAEAADRIVADWRLWVPQTDVASPNTAWQASSPSNTK